MTRRNFVQSLSAASLAATATLSGAAPQRRKLKKAVNLRMINAPAGATVSESFKMARDAGFEGIELNLPDDGLTVENLLAAKSASGLEIAGIICTPHWKFPLSDPDASVRERTIRGLRLALEQGGALGCSRVLLVPGVVTEKVDYAQCWSRAVEGIKRCTDAAERARCHIAVENVWNQFIMNPVEATRFVDEINHPWVGWHFDIGNCVTYGWPEQWARILGSRIRNVHIKDFSRKKANDEGLRKGFAVELGEGDVSWATTMSALDEIGYQGWGIAEVPGGDAARLRFLSERMGTLFNS